MLLYSNFIYLKLKCLYRKKKYEQISRDSAQQLLTGIPYLYILPYDHNLRGTIVITICRAIKKWHAHKTKITRKIQIAKNNRIKQ